MISDFSNMSAKYNKIFFTVTNDLITDQRMQRITETLASAGWDVTLIGRKLALHQPHDEINQGVRWKRFKLLFNKGKLFYLEYNLRLFLFFLFKKNYLLSAIDFDTLPNAMLLKMLTGREFVLDAHEYFTEVPELEGRVLSKSVWKYIGNVAIPKAKLCYTVNSSLATILSQEFGNNFDYIRNLPYMMKPSQQSTSIEGKRIILYQGALNIGRGIEQGIEAIKYLPATYVYWIAGGGDIEDELKEYAREIGVSDRVVFLGRLSPQELKSVTMKAWCGLNILEGDSYNYYYSLANKFFDYVNANVPAINMYFPEYIKHNKSFEVSVLIKQCSSEAIVEAIGKLEVLAYYEHLTDNCRKAALVWNWENEAQKLIGLYEGFKD